MAHVVRRRLGILLVAGVLGLMGVFGVSPALADPPDVVGPGEGPFLCPSLGQGVVNHRPDAGQLPDGSFTFLPGHNQAGAHANSNALNTQPPALSPGPGSGNSDWSPIWPY